jgi:methylated-DNA-[protein]-cysteine S-methyltransferase
MKQIDIQYYKTKYGEFILGTYNNQLCMVDYRYRKMRSRIDKRLQTQLKATYNEQDNATLQETRQQLEEYFQGKRKTFTLPLLFVGSNFQKNVWNTLLQIPYGTTLSYKTLAQKIGDEKAVRAVANANGANAIGIIVPCHRVIASDGTLGGYAGGLALKKRLLTLENNLFTSTS